ncbi:MAG: hypothetical protein Q8J78_05610 [Moraxellaceae bacterium]|nr:hypothetical protein [Moraxellaceae bacterium]
MPAQDEFAVAAARNPDALDGEYAVHLVAPFLPRPLRFFGHTKVFRREGSVTLGYNRFLGGLIKTGRFYVARGRAEDGSEVTQILYDLPDNPFFMRPLTDEVRETAPGRFLGRGIMTIAGRARRVFWFTVTRA